jgi:hypothetical protein
VTIGCETEGEAMKIEIVPYDNSPAAAAAAKHYADVLKGSNRIWGWHPSNRLRDWCAKKYGDCGFNFSRGYASKIGVSWPWWARITCAILHFYCGVGLHRDSFYLTTPALQFVWHHGNCCGTWEHPVAQYGPELKFIPRHLDFMIRPETNWEYYVGKIEWVYRYQRKP